MIGSLATSSRWYPGGNFIVFILSSGERNAEDGLGSILDGLSGGGASCWLQEMHVAKMITATNVLIEIGILNY
jgi:hypothetical protein